MHPRSRSWEIFLLQGGRGNQNNGLYPTSKATPPESKVDPVNLCSNGLGFTNCPVDPKSPTYFYSYISEVGNPIYSAKSTKYVLWAKLENISPTTYWVVCSGGSSGKTTTNPSSSTCPTLAN